MMGAIANTWGRTGCGGGAPATVTRVPACREVALQPPSEETAATSTLGCLSPTAAKPATSEHHLSAPLSHSQGSSFTRERSLPFLFRNQF